MGLDQGCRSDSLRLKPGCKRAASALSGPPSSVRLCKEPEGQAGPKGTSAQLPKAEVTFPPPPRAPDPLPPRCPHHAVGKSKAVRVGDDLQEDVHGVQ